MKNFLICIVFTISSASRIVFAQEAVKTPEGRICFIECEKKYDSIGDAIKVFFSFSMMR